MGELSIDDVSNDIIAEYQGRAKRANTTLQSVLREALAREALRPRLELCERLQKLRDEIRANSGELFDCTAIIRDGRDNGW